MKVLVQPVQYLNLKENNRKVGLFTFQEMLNSVEMYLAFSLSYTLTSKIQ